MWGISIICGLKVVDPLGEVKEFYIILCDSFY